jgi:hypothetical protein
MSSTSPVQQIPTPETIRAATRSVLDRPEFAEPPRWHQSLVDMMLAVKEWLDRLSGWSEANPTLAKVLFVLAVIILLACLGHVLYLMLADTPLFRRATTDASRRSARWEILEGAATDWHDALQLARAKLAEGDLKRAVWIAHRVLLGLLDQQGAVHFAGWKTNSHYLRECAPTHPWHKPFAEITDLYEQIVYASRQVPAAHVEASVTQIDRLCAASGGQS